MNAREQLKMDVDVEGYNEIRSLWIKHSKAEDERDLDGLISTLAPNCVYEVIPTGQRWEGHEGARQFYTTFLGAYPDVKFELIDIVIGPQGVIEVTQMTGTNRGTWAGLEGTGARVDMPIVIHFPWSPEHRRFLGEKVYFDKTEMAAQLGA
jgi:predicted ester cyclase